MPASVFALSDPTAVSAVAVPTTASAAPAAQLEVAAMNHRLRADDAQARRLMRMSVLLLADGDERSRRASERFMAEAFERGASVVAEFLARAEEAGTIGAIHLGPDGAYAPCSRVLAVPGHHRAGGR
jgi:hypothetical protein